MIDKLRKCQNIDEIIKEIKKFYESYDDNYYLPAINQEGSYISKEFNLNIETDLVFYDVTLFGDELHLNEKGAEIYSNNLKRKYHL